MMGLLTIQLSKQVENFMCKLFLYFSFMRHIFIIFLLLISGSVNYTYGQDKKAYVNFPSPNAASLGIFGTVPVNHFTGIPNIEIPIYELAENDLTIPIALRYHTASVKLNAHPGSVGLGWSLAGIGSISRVVNGHPDESKTVNSNAGITHYAGYYFNYFRLSPIDRPFWSEVNRIKQYAIDLSYGSPPYEVMPDVFHFNFLGYSGKFYLDHTRNWVVQSDKPIKVIFEPTNGGFVTKADLREPIQSKMPFFQAVSDNYFNKFTLVTEDGTQFVFGGTDATEYSTSYRKPYENFVIPTTFFLTKIISSNKKTIEYTYEPGKLICSIANGYNYLNYDKPGGAGWHNTNGACSGTVGGTFERLGAQGHLIFPVYLKQITSDNKKIIFTRSVSTELRHWDFDLEPNPETDGMSSFYYYFNNKNELQWEKYDAIEIRSKSDVLFKKFIFEYTNSTSTRLKLLSLKEVDPSGKTGLVHKFFYNPNNMSPYCADQLDHWGFFNNYNLALFKPATAQNWLDGYPATRNPDPTGTYNKYEILEKIQYPTLGYTVLTYEPHTYSKTVDRTRKDFIPFSTNQIAGGLRIKNISIYQPDKTLASSKDYYYVKLNADQDNLTTGPSSGILNAETQYYWPAFRGKDIGTNQDFTYDLFSSNSLLPTPFDDGSHISYSEVIEKTNTNGWNKYTYTNYEADIYGATHFDEPAIAYIDAERSIYSPYTSKSLERGKLTSQITYKEDKSKVKEVFNSYTPSSSNFIRANYSEYLRICKGQQVGAQNWYGTSFVYYTYNYNLIKTEETLYNQADAASSVKTTTEYEYNAYNLVNKVKTMSSKEESIVKKIKYASDYSPAAATFLPDMLAKNMVGSVIEQQVWKTKDNVSKLITGSLTDYAKFGTSQDIFLPYKQYNLEVDSPLSETEFGETAAQIAPYTIFNPNPTYYQENSSLGYTDFGKVNQVNLRGGINTAYIWGYSGLLPTAEVKNATKAQIAYTSFETDTDLGNFDYTSNNAAFYSTDAKTGSRSYYLYSAGVNHDLVRNLPVGNYIVSYWAKGTGSVKVGPNTPKAVTAIWSFQEVTVNLPTTQDLRIVGIANSVLLDEVRIIPLGSQITTYTYNPLIGISTSTDLNGLSTYFEYDSFGRLKLTRIDNGIQEKGTITKKYFYRYGK